jgi:hypothetical protein
VPGQVKKSLAEAGEAPEAAGSRRAVHDKSRVEGELLGYAAEVDAEHEEAARRAQQQPMNSKGPRPGGGVGALGRMDSGPQTPSTGVAVVLGTETDRSFPLGSHPVHHGGMDGAEEDGVGAAERQAQRTGHSSSSPSSRPVATDGVRTGEVPQTSSGHQRGQESARRPPVEDKVPVRTTEETAVGNGPDVYQKLSSGTPSGVGQ